MKINFKKIEVTNFMRFQDTQTLEIKEGMSLITGLNGCGKSTIITDALFYNLFKKPFRKMSKLTELVNDQVGKGMKTQVTFEIGDDTYVVTRNMKPDLFLIEKNGDEIERLAKLDDYQSLLEEILCSNEKIFRQLVVLGANMSNSKPFLELSPAEKEELFNSLIDTQIFKDIKDECKKCLKEDKEYIKELEYKLKIQHEGLIADELQVKKLEAHNAEIELRKEVETEATLGEIETLKGKIVSLQEELEKGKKYQPALDKSNELKETLSNERSELEELSEEMTTEYEEIVTKHNELIDKASETLEEAIDEINVRYDAIDMETDSDICDEITKIATKQEVITNKQSDIDAILDELHTEEVQLRITEIPLLEGKKKGLIDTIEGNLCCPECSHEFNASGVDAGDVIQVEVEISKLEVVHKELLAEIELNNQSVKKLQIAYDKLETLSDAAEVKGKELKTKSDNSRKEDIQAQKDAGKDSLTSLKYIRNTAQEAIKKNNINTVKERSEINIKIEKNNSRIDILVQKLQDAEVIDIKIKTANESILRLQDELKKIEDLELLDIDRSAITKRKKEVTRIENKVVELQDDMGYVNIILDWISEDNMKAVVLATQLPILNAGINEYLNKFSTAEFMMVIGNNYKETITVDDKPRTFSAFSNGQKARITWAILFAFLKFVSEKNGIETNILVLDEVLDSSLDFEGKDELLQIIHEEFSFTKDVFVISHSPDIKENELFSRVLNVTTENSVSKIS